MGRMPWAIMSNGRCLSYGIHYMPMLKQAQNFCKTVTDIELIHSDSRDVWFKFTDSELWMRRDGCLTMIKSFKKGN